MLLFFGQNNVRKGGELMKKEVTDGRSFEQKKNEQQISHEAKVPKAGDKKLKGPNRPAD